VYVRAPVCVTTTVGARVGDLCRLHIECAVCYI
jgi:hypothetical protein